MSTIKELRKSGKLEEAYELATQKLESDPENIWNKRELAWVLYEYLKKYAFYENKDDFLNYLEKLVLLNLGDDEDILYESILWQLTKTIYSTIKQQSIDQKYINSLIEYCKQFQYPKPSNVHSALLKAMLGIYETYAVFLSFVNWWNIDNLREEDYEKEEYQGRNLLSIAERTYIAISKKLLAGNLDPEAFDPIIAARIINKNAINDFLPYLDKIIDSHPEYTYPPYYKAKLMLSIGDHENVVKVLTPFARDKSNEFWVWQLIGEAVSGDIELQIACYSKALSCKSPDKFLVKVREVFIKILLDKEYYNQAKTEISLIDHVREQEGWHPSSFINKIKDQKWYNEAEPNLNNNDFYWEHIPKAEALIYNDIPEEVVVIEYVNNEKKILNFIKDKSKRGFLKYSSFIKKPSIGDIIKVRLGENTGDYFKVFTLVKCDESVSCEAIRHFEGEIRILSNADIGFVDDVFFDPKIIDKNKIVNNQFVNGRAILSFNKKKNEWGWKAVKFEL